MTREEMLKMVEEMKEEITKLTCKSDELEAQLHAEEPDPVVYPTFVPIPARSYEASETPVTVGQYRAFCVSMDRAMPDQPDPQNDLNPVVNVTYDDALAYCAWLSDEIGAVVDLPSEDEWRYMCADHVEANPDIAVYDQPHIMPVKTKQPNKFGLYDMLGLVWEWTSSPF